MLTPGLEQPFRTPTRTSCSMRRLATLPTARNEQLMHSWVFLRQRRPWLTVTLAICCLSVCTFATAPLAAQEQLTRSAEPVFVAPELPATSLDGVLAEGSRLESLGRWGEAVTHYEEALRETPENVALQQRSDLAKLHFSLDRRYADRSFVQSLQTLTPQQAAALYLELARKINTHYVTAPRWQYLAQRGAAAVEIGLGEATFCSANGLNLSNEQRAAIRSELYQLTTRPVNGPDELAAFAAEIARLIESRCNLRQSATFLEFTAAAAGGLDEYSAFLTADQLRDVYSQIEGNFVGLGVELKADKGALLIVHVIPGSPAERAGIKDGDRIVAVDGRSTEELSTDEAAAMLTGEEGTAVRVVAETAGQRRELTVRREHVEVPSLEDVKIADPVNGVAYIKIPAFQKTTSRDLDAALWDLHAKGMRSLVLDLRGNPGGLLTAAVEVADKFLQQGGIVSTRGRSAQEDFNYQAHYGGTWRVPLVVLVDGDSASASEIFAAAIKDNARGDIVGQKSYGKGSVQGIFPLGYAGAGIRLTTALFYSPNGQKISKNGVTPNIAVESARTAAKPIQQPVTVAANVAPGGYTAAKPSTGVSELTIVGQDAVLEAGVRAAVSAAQQRVAAPAAAETVK
jgi:carboxyl-terminal processing protease